MWTKRRTLFDGGTAPEDWTVYRNGQPVGRVCRVHPHSPVSLIRWAAWVDPCGNGIVEDHGAALDALRRCIRTRWPDGPGWLPEAGRVG